MTIKSIKNKFELIKNEWPDLTDYQTLCIVMEIAKHGIIEEALFDDDGERLLDKIASKLIALEP